MSTIAPEFIIEKSFPALIEHQWASIEGIFSDDELDQLLNHAENKWNKGEFKSAQIGRSSHLHLNQSIRSDATCWIDEASLPVDFFWERLGLMKNILNQNLFLGIQNFEGHFARYESGQKYDRHIDQSPLKSQLHGERLMTFIIYLNRNWTPSQGGELCIYQQDREVKIAPTWGKVILFKSDEISHAVLASHGLRWSLTGWFRRS